MKACGDMSGTDWSVGIDMNGRGSIESGCYELDRSHLPNTLNFFTRWPRPEKTLNVFRKKPKPRSGKNGRSGRGAKELFIVINVTSRSPRAKHTHTANGCSVTTAAMTCGGAMTSQKVSGPRTAAESQSAVHHPPRLRSRWFCFKKDTNLQIDANS